MPYKRIVVDEGCFILFERFVYYIGTLYEDANIIFHERLVGERCMLRTAPMKMNIQACLRSVPL